MTGVQLKSVITEFYTELPLIAGRLYCQHHWTFQLILGK